MLLKTGLVSMKIIVIQKKMKHKIEGKMFSYGQMSEI